MCQLSALCSIVSMDCFTGVSNALIRFMAEFTYQLWFLCLLELRWSESVFCIVSCSSCLGYFTISAWRYFWLLLNSRNLLSFHSTQRSALRAASLLQIPHRSPNTSLEIEVTRHNVYCVELSIFHNVFIHFVINIVTLNILTCIHSPMLLAFP